MKVFTKRTFVLMMVFLSWNIFSSFTEGSKARFQTVTTVEELVIQIPRVSEKNFSDFLSGLQSIDGVTVAGYCGELHCFMLLVDRDINPTNAPIFNKMKSQGKILVKRGTTFKQVQANCSNYTAFSVSEEASPAQN